MKPLHNHDVIPAAQRRSPGRPPIETERIVEAALQIVDEGDAAALSMRTVATRLNSSTSTIYRHFPSKESLLVELLVGISTRLLEGAQAVLADAPDAGAALDRLIDFHLDFALGEPDLIRIQDRDLSSLPAAAQRQVRRAQRRYVETWVEVLRELDPRLREDDARVMAHAAFGLLNSTPHSLKTAAARSAQHSREVLRTMTAAALGVGAG